MSRAWLFLAAGDSREHGGNYGYENVPDAHYSWDSTVPNHASVKRGDRVVLWDKRLLIGASVVEEIETDWAEKPLKTCPVCKSSTIKARKSETLRRYKCRKGHEFDEAELVLKRVMTYRSIHDAGWVDLEGRLDGATLRSLCHSPKSVHSIRRLNWDRFAAAIGEVSNRTELGRLVRRSGITGGHVRVTVRVRKGQRSFRRRLLEEQGAVCAFTGSMPEPVLEAGHLYSYADVGEHHDHGGLLLRRDVHRLFDNGDLAIDPGTGKISISERLMPYSVYASLMDARLRVPVSQRQRAWLHVHWETHRS